MLSVALNDVTEALPPAIVGNEKIASVPKRPLRIFLILTRVTTAADYGIFEEGVDEELRLAMLDASVEDGEFAFGQEGRRVRKFDLDVHRAPADDCAPATFHRGDLDRGMAGREAPDVDRPVLVCVEDEFPECRWVRPSTVLTWPESLRAIGVGTVFDSAFGEKSALNVNSIFGTGTVTEPSAPANPVRSRAIKAQRTAAKAAPFGSLPRVVFISPNLAGVLTSPSRPPVGPSGCRA